MYRYFPSKKVFVVGVLAVALLAWVIVYEGTSQQKSAIQDSVLLTVAHAGSAFPDSDNDGLYDWEEVLYGTDIYNPDSDNNGVSDGKQHKSESSSFSNLLFSDSVYAAINRLGQDIENFPNPVDLLSQEPKEYEAPFSSINLTFRDDGQEDHDAYIVDAMFTLSAHASVLKEDPLRLTQEWLETKKPDTLEKIQKLNEETMLLAQSFLSIPVPPHYASTHLEIANNLFLSGLSLQEIEITNVDPMAGFFAVANYTNYQSKYLAAVDSIIGFGAESNE